MKFNGIYFLIFTSILCYKMIFCDNSVAKKWHIVNETLCYIEVKQQYSASDAFEICESMGMINYVGYDYISGFKEYIASFYGYMPTLWSANQGYCEHSTAFPMLLAEQVRENSCFDSAGFICATNILHGEIKFKNGTELLINKGDVIKYCDPQAQDSFNQQHCLIVFDRILL